ncbi:VirB3 family type IV secretion system protein [Photobacterium carnosum]|uniref:VirB3 family type IV secretion system protein n=1 Tax=Photobacterium carnosum TaxID=2023717 RepID=UPI001E4FA483|nr:VirB3 family type IV secretion system protein [Photobacterium carnosum]MCD9538974.1 type VI secretion protein [Photobacterium carnosum]MCF2163672.1 type VI secretion protein [Photobacterium carnosum]MCF2307916.1 type VI secretion protein [Photobacterium carnosum]
MDVVYKALTRPAMFMGVPLIPLMFVSLPLIVISFWFNRFGFGLWGLFSLFPAYGVMAFISRNDDHYLSLYVLRLKYRPKNSVKGVIVYYSRPFSVK